METDKPILNGEVKNPEGIGFISTLPHWMHIHNVIWMMLKCKEKVTK